MANIGIILFGLVALWEPCPVVGGKEVTCYMFRSSSYLRNQQTPSSPWMDSLLDWETEDDYVFFINTVGSTTAIVRNYDARVALDSSNQVHMDENDNTPWEYTLQSSWDDFILRHTTPGSRYLCSAGHEVTVTNVTCDWHCHYWTVTYVATCPANLEDSGYGLGRRKRQSGIQAAFTLGSKVQLYQYRYELDTTRRHMSVRIQSPGNGNLACSRLSPRPSTTRPVGAKVTYERLGSNIRSTKPDSQHFLVDPIIERRGRRLGILRCHSNPRYVLAWQGNTLTAVPYRGSRGQRLAVVALCT